MTESADDENPQGVKHLLSIEPDAFRQAGSLRRRRQQ